MTIHSAIRNVMATLSLAMLVGCQADMSSNANPTSTGEASIPAAAARTEMRVVCPDEPVVRNVYARTMEFLVTPADARVVQYTVRAVLGANTSRVLSVPASSLQPSGWVSGGYLVVSLDNLPATIWSDVGGATFVVEGWSNASATGTPLTTQSFPPNRARGSSISSKDLPYACLRYDEGLFPGEYLSSPNGTYRLWAQNDGNVVLYRKKKWFGIETWSAVWWTLHKRLRGPATLVMQADGNLVTYDKSVATWATMRFGSARSMTVQDDGNVVVSDCSAFYTCSAVWNRMTDPSTEF